MPAYDAVIQAASGMMNVNGHPETGPTRTGFFLIYMSTGLTAVLAISAVLYRVRKRARGSTWISP